MRSPFFAAFLGVLLILPLGPLRFAAAEDEPGVAATNESAGAKTGTQSLDWPQFRGPEARGWVEGSSVPATWDIESGENVRWRAPIDGLGLSSPVSAAGRVFVTTAVGENEPDFKIGLYGDVRPADDDSKHRFELWCIDLASGERRWKVVAHEGVPKVSRHTKSSHANSTPATDGKRVIAFFGSEGIYCYDVDGKPLWKRDLGLLDAGFFHDRGMQWGFGSSPVIFRDRVLVQCDVQDESFIAALDLESGDVVWRTKRDEVPTWSTPTVAVHDGVPYIITNGFQHIGAYRLDDGKELWRLGARGGDIPVPTPIVDSGLIYITNAHGRLSPIYAIRPGLEGELEPPGDDGKSSAIAWSIPRGGNYMQTPLAYQGLLFACRDNGVLTCFDAKTGEQHWQLRLGGGRDGFTASPIASDGRIYVTGESGEVHVIAAEKEQRELAKQSLGEISMATPAIANGDTLLFRGRRHLIAIRAAKKESAK